MNPIDQLFALLYGLPCWNAKSGYGSFLTMEFGEPYLEVHEPRIARPGASERVHKSLARRRVFVHGEWHLWIYCCEWHVYTGDTLMGDSDLQGSTKERIDLAAAELDSQRLTRVEVDPHRGTSTFHFDLGSRLETWPYEPNTKQWYLYQPDGNVLAYRSDGYYKQCPGDASPAAEVWKPLFTMVSGFDTGAIIEGHRLLLSS
jgi:hypothetical protein